jgi:hypothetical protein
MSGLATWQDDNSRYLEASLAWLRARLEYCAGHGQETLALAFPAQVSTPEAPSKSFWNHLIRRTPPESPAKTPALLPAERSRPAGDRVAQAARQVAAAAQTNPPPALLLLSQRLGLSQFEREILLLCAAMELDVGIGALCARAQGDPNRPYPTFALAMALFDMPAWDALSPENPLRYWRLIEINQPGGQPLTTSPLRVDERIVNYLKGLNYLDDRLTPLLAPLDVTTSEPPLPPSQQRAVETIVQHVKQRPAGQSVLTIQLLGADAPSKHLVVAHAVAELGLRAHQLPVSLLPAQAGDLETFARLWDRESLLLPVALYVDALGSDVDAPPAGQSSPVSRLLARLGGVVFLDTRDVWPGLAQSSLPVDVVKPTAAEQKAAWGASLGTDAGDAPAVLAGQFNLGLSSIRRIARETVAGAGENQSAFKQRLWDACLAETRPRLDILAQRLEPKATWDDIVLPTSEAELLRQIAAQVAQRSQVYQGWGFVQKMSRGFGISALFAGDSGVGKTMAAEVIANHLRLNLYRIDLSAVVSKYIGETEKNLRRLFDAAEDGGAILFFDEADALFGKRSEVKDSHDRYANIEINYLLQRMEAYRGLAILATNMKSALDPAFMRRLRFVVNFPFPGVAERKAIWQKVFPSAVPTENLDFDALARLNLTGGNIQSVALNAAFSAAESGRPVTTDLLLGMARAELRKLNRPFNELQFRRQAVAEGAR